MTPLETLSRDDLVALRRRIEEQYGAFRARGLHLDLTRGKPSPEQLDLSNPLLDLPGWGNYRAADGSDCRNYFGDPAGLPEARALFALMLGAAPDQVLIGDNSSLALMHDALVYALLHGVPTPDRPGGDAPWGRGEPIAFLCPSPGYDRHFALCEGLGIRMIPVALTGAGPDLAAVERLVAADPSIKGIWCVPKYSNPTGAVYSDAVVERMAAMKTAAPDFRVYWDNAYSVHHLTDERIEIASILDLAARHGNPNRPLVFGSTSKITFSGSGLAMMAASKDNVKWLLARLTPRTIGPDKINQLRHVRFLKSEAGIMELMDRHRALIAPKFRKVLDVFAEKLSDTPGVSWTTPKGGYFISLEVPRGHARKVIALAKEAGVQLTPAGSTHPYGNDPNDSTIRIAPTFPELSEVSEAVEGVAMCVRLAIAGS